MSPKVFEDGGSQKRRLSPNDAFPPAAQVPDEAAVTGGLGERSGKLNGMKAVLEKFGNDKLLAHTFPHNIGSYVAPQTLFNKLDEGPIAHLSTSVMVNGARSDAYGGRGVGFILDSERVNIEEVSLTDANSFVDKNGELVAGGRHVDSVTEAARLYREMGLGGKHQTEANVGFSKEDNAILGLFAQKGNLDKETLGVPSAMMDALTTKLHLKKEAGVDLPIFVYDSHEGTLEPWIPTKDDVNHVIDNLRIKPMGDVYRKECERLGFPLTK